MSADNAMTGIFLESKRKPTGVEEKNAVLKPDGLQARRCPVRAPTDVC